MPFYRLVVDLAGKKRQARSAATGGKSSFETPISLLANARTCVSLFPVPCCVFRKHANAAPHPHNYP
jgi:hypothetical protein